MASIDPAETLLTEAQQTTLEIRAALADPTSEALRGVLPLCEHAAARLQSLHELLGSHPDLRTPQLKAMALELQREGARLRVLLEAAAGFRLGWIRRLGTQVAGYTAQGSPSPLAGAQRVLAEG